MFLWATLALISQKKPITEVHTEIIPIPNNEWESYIKFDNIKAPYINSATRAGLESLYSRMKYIIDQYSESHVCIIPQVRNINYKHNYYASEFYPGLIFYDRNKNKVSYLPFLDNEGEKQIYINTKTQTTTKYKNIAGAIKENEMTYNYVFPISILDNGYSEAYYILLRTIPHIVTSYDDEKGIVVSDFRIDVEDLSVELYDRTERDSIIEYFEKETDTESEDYEEWSSSIAEENESVSDYSIHVNHWIQDETLIDPTEITPEPVSFTITKGYYQGEFPSYLYSLLAPTYTIEVQPISLAPLASDYHDILALSPNTSEADFNTILNTTLTNIRNRLPNDIDKEDAMEHLITGIHPSEEADLRATMDTINGDMRILKTFAEEHDHSTDEIRNYILYTGARYSNLFEYDINSHNDWAYYTIENDELVRKDYSDNNKQHYLHTQGNIGWLAVLYNPILNTFTEYTDYKAWGSSPWGWYTTGSSAGGISYSFTYLDDTVKIMTDTNWYVRYTQIQLVAGPDERISDFYSSFIDHGKRTVNCRIATHIFGPEKNGVPFYACKILDRYDTIPNNQNLETADLRNWTVNYINKANFDYFESIKSNLIILSAADKDYEIYPNTGAAATEQQPTIIIN